MSNHSPLDEAIARFLRGLQHDRVAHAYLVVGPPDGSGRLFTVRLMQYMLCEHPDSDGRPCGQCRACGQVERFAHPDVAAIEPESKSRVITIEQIRAMNRRMAESSYLGGWKIGVLQHADRMQAPAANAFLKTLEEPPGKALLLLLTDQPQTLLPTIVSRCQRILLPAVADPELEARRIPLLDVLAQTNLLKPLGRMRFSNRLNDFLNKEREQLLDQLNAEEHEDREKKIMEARIEARIKKIRSELLATLLLWHRDVLLRTLDVDEALLHFPAYREAINQQADRLGYGAAQSLLRELEQAIGRLERNIQLPIALESMTFS